MYHDGEDVFYYVTLYNENYAQPPKPDGRRRGRSSAASTGSPRRPTSDRKAPPRPARRLGLDPPAGHRGAATSSPRRLGIAAEVYSAPSFPLLRRDALEAERWNRLHPTATPRVPYVSTVLGPDGGPIVAATDWMKALPDMVAPLAPAVLRRRSAPTASAGSDTREALRALFEIDPPHIAAAALAELAPLRRRCRPPRRRRRSRELGVDPEKLDPLAT